MIRRVRADELLARQGLCSSRTAARHLIEEGRAVLSQGERIRKPSQAIPEDSVVSILPGDDYVSRGAKKLLGAIEHFSPILEGKTCLDLGASTGGFTEVLLRHGAAKVFAVDVGTGQLHPRLRADSRVISLEQTNARELTQALIPEPIEFLTGDLSFISLTKVLPAVCPLLSADFSAILLIKPQFEAEKGEIASGGILRDDAIRQRCVSKIVTFCTRELGWQHKGTIESPITGGDGNIEYLAMFTS